MVGVLQSSHREEYLFIERSQGPDRRGYIKYFRTALQIVKIRIDQESDQELVYKSLQYSMEYALSWHGILSQDVHTYTLVTTKLPHTYRSDEDIFEYHQIKRSLFWGFKIEGTVQVAVPEKALLDLLYIRYTRNRNASERTILSLMDDMYLEELDKKKLDSFSKKFDKTTRRILYKVLSV